MLPNKYMTNTNGRKQRTMRAEMGVHLPSPLRDRDVNLPGKSHASFQKTSVEKYMHKTKLKELRSMPKLNLPK